jgi:glutathione S-transferase
MKLHYSPASPYARKVLACAVARNIDDRITLTRTDPYASTEELVRENPLSKIPCLVTDDGRAVFDSPVICEYLDTLGEAPPLFPPAGSNARLEAQIRHALADGIMDAALLRRVLGAQPAEEHRAAFMARQQAAIDRALAALEASPPEGLADIGTIAVGCALGYLDFRFAHEPWRAAHPRLADWYAEVGTLPALTKTAPPA